jgi:hypothetical protein
MAAPSRAVTGEEDVESPTPETLRAAACSREIRLPEASGRGKSMGDLAEDPLARDLARHCLLAGDLTRHRLLEGDPLFEDLCSRKIRSRRPHTVAKETRAHEGGNDMRGGGLGGVWVAAIVLCGISLSRMSSEARFELHSSSRL